MKLLLILMLTSISIAVTGCSIGVKEKQTIVYAGFAKDPEELKGAIRIATNKQIPVTVVGEKDISTTKDLGAMIAVREADFKALVRSWNERKQNKKE